MTNLKKLSPKNRASRGLKSIVDPLTMDRKSLVVRSLRAQMLINLTSQVVTLPLQDHERPAELFCIQITVHFIGPWSI